MKYLKKKKNYLLLLRFFLSASLETSMLSFDWSPKIMNSCMSRKENVLDLLNYNIQKVWNFKKVKVISMRLKL